MGEGRKQTAAGKAVRLFGGALSRGLFLLWRYQAFRHPAELIVQRNLAVSVSRSAYGSFFQNSCKVSQIFLLEGLTTEVNRLGMANSDPRQAGGGGAK
jgi:hypothetical protein